MATTPMFAPDGTLGDVPNERVAEATKSGFKTGQEFISPQGIPGVIPTERAVEAMRSGFMPRSMANMPGNPASQPQMQSSNLGIALGSENQGVANPQQPAEQFALQHPDQQLPLAGAAALGAAGTASVAAAPVAIPAIQAAARAHPIISTMLASEAISQARRVPYLGKMIPPYSEMIPMLMGGKGAPAEPTAAPETIWEAPPKPPVSRPAPGWQTQGVTPTEPGFNWKTSTPEEVQAQLNRMANRPKTSRAEGQSAESSYQVQSIPVQGVKTPSAQGTPNLPEMQPAQSTTIAQHGYDPASQRMYVQFKNGNVYRYSGVPQKVYDQYVASESQGSFHAHQLKGRYQTDLIGKVKPSSTAVKDALSSRGQQ